MTLSLVSAYLIIKKMSNAAQKTPISLLQELCVQQGITADYKLMSVEGAVHAPTFMFRVQVGDIVATATGASKKKAKHAAAKAALEKLLTESGGFADGFVSDGVLINAITLSEVIASSTVNDPSDTQASEDVKGNPVGALQEKCMQKRWQPPYYETKEEKGLPHEREFTVECQVEQYTEQGVGKSKRLAKRQAAHKMMQRLLSMEKDGDDDDDDGKNKYTDLPLNDKYSKMRGNKKLADQSLYYERVQEFLSDIKSSKNPCLLTLQEIDLTDENLDCVDLLQNIAQEQDFSVSYMPIEQPGKSGKYHCLVQLNSLPVAVCFGMGDSVEDAKVNCARNALSFIQVMCQT